jgi:hypothetical protein
MAAEESRGTGSTRPAVQSLTILATGLSARTANGDLERPSTADVGHLSKVSKPFPTFDVEMLWSIMAEPINSHTYAHNLPY